MGSIDLNTTVTRNAKEVFDLLHDDLAAIDRIVGQRVRRHLHHGDV